MKSAVALSTVPGTWQEFQYVSSHYPCLHFRHRRHDHGVCMQEALPTLLPRSYLVMIQLKTPQTNKAPMAIEKGYWRLIYNPDDVFPLLMLFLTHTCTHSSHPSSCLILSISFFSHCFVWKKIRRRGAILATESGTWDLCSHVCLCIQRSHIPNPTMLNALRRDSVKLKAWYRHACESKEETL